MRALAIIEFALGALIVLLALFDVFQTVVLPRPTPATFRPSSLLVRALYVLCRRAALRWSKQREQLLGMFAPLVVVVLLIYWAVGLTLGFSVVLHALRAQIHPTPNFGAALYFAAMSLFSFGFGDLIPTGGLARFVVIIEAATGLALFAVIITYLFGLFGEFERREVLVVTLSNRAGAPPSGVGLLEMYARNDMVNGLAGLFADWEIWSANVLESHLSYPILAFFRSTHDNQSWISALGAVLDAATLVLTTIQGVPRGPARLMVHGGLHLVEDLGQYYRFDGPREPFVEQEEFVEACAQLQSAGFELRDTDEAWKDFSQSRGQYASVLNAMARQWITPPAQWIGDRSALVRHSGRVVRR
jgi:hypothetical protein